MSSDIEAPIYIYSIDYFLNKKKEINKTDENLKKILTDIYSKHECFNETIVNRRPLYSKYKYKKNSYKYNNYKEISENNRKKNKTDIQLVLGYLNKLSNTNYKDLSEKIISNISHDNYIKIINKLFEISYKQTTYYKLYINLFEQIINIDNKELVKNINNYIISQINDIILNKNEDLTLINKHIDKVKLEYDDFCDINKNAKFLKGKIYIISKLIKNEIIDINKEYLIDTIFKYKNYDNEIFLEVLQILNNILKLDDEKIRLLQEYIDITNFKGKMMLKFKLKDIIDNKIIKSF